MKDIMNEHVQSSTIEYPMNFVLFLRPGVLTT